jgi:hypothetical protein
MVKLLDDGDNILTRIQSTDAITAGSVLKSAKKRADDLSTTTGKTILPTFTTRTEAQEEADRLNVINQSVIGAKEGVVEAVSKLVGSDITDAILRTADGSDFKSIDDYTLYEVMKVAIDGADRPIDHERRVGAAPRGDQSPIRLSKKGQCQHGVDAIECGTNGHIWNRHRHPTTHTHTVGQHRDRHQIRVRS